MNVQVVNRRVLEAYAPLTVGMFLIEGGDLLYREPPMMPAAAVEISSRTGKAKRKYNKRKATTAAVETTVETATTEPTTTAAATETTTTKKKGWRRRRRNTNAIEVPLSDCLGVAAYDKADGTTMDVAIYQTGLRKDSSRWYLLLFISEDMNTASHDSGGFPGKAEKMHDINWFAGSPPQ